jgi:hypothetical protein
MKRKQLGPVIATVVVLAVFSLMCYLDPNISGRW